MQDTALLRRANRLGAFAAVLLGSASLAHAAPANLFSYNVVVTNNFITANHTEGAVFAKNLSVSNSPVFTGNVYVAGTLSGDRINANNGATLTTASSLPGGFQVQNGTSSIDATLPAQLNSLTSQLSSISSQLAAVSQTNGASISVSGANVTFNLPAAATGTVTFTLNLASNNIFNLQNLNIAFNNLTSGVTAVINVVSNASTQVINPQTFNFQQQTDFAASRVLWNFTTATSFTNNGTFYGTILGPNLTVNTNSRNIYGGIYVANINQPSGEIHLPLYTGSLPGGPSGAPLPGVPLPSAALTGGSLLTGLVLRRNRRA